MAKLQERQSSLSSWTSVVVIGVLFLILDAITKNLTVQYFCTAGSEGHSLLIFKNLLGIDFSLTYAENRGAAWGFFSEAPILLVVVRLLLIFSLAYYLFFGRVRPQFRLPMMLILSGAIGNVIDFFVYGYVIDMMHFSFWGYNYPVFNLADAIICIGTLWIVYLVINEPKLKTKSSS